MPHILRQPTRETTSAGGGVRVVPQKQGSISCRTPCGNRRGRPPTPEAAYAWSLRNRVSYHAVHLAPTDTRKRLEYADDQRGRRPTALAWLINTSPIWGRSTGRGLNQATINGTSLGPSFYRLACLLRPFVAPEARQRRGNVKFGKLPPARRGECTLLLGMRLLSWTWKISPTAGKISVFLSFAWKGSVWSEDVAV